MWLLENRKSRLWRPRVALTAGQPSAGAAATRWDEEQGGDGLPVLSGVGGDLHPSGLRGAQSWHVGRSSGTPG